MISFPFCQRQTRHELVDQEAHALQHRLHIPRLRVLMQSGYSSLGEAAFAGEKERGKAGLMLYLHGMAVHSMKR